MPEPQSKSKPAKKPFVRKPLAKNADGVVLLSGGNPQIAKGDGDPPVQAYIAAVPGWKQAIARDLDALIAETIPAVKKAVRWNTPFYGIDSQGWFLGMHCFNNYLKLTFLNGSLLTPLPPIASKHPATRYLHIFEAGFTDEAQLIDWIRQAAALPGEKCF
jgi:hypothetical protein